MRAANKMALLCGGWFTTDSGQSLPKQNFLKGEDQMSRYCRYYRYNVYI